MTGPFDDTHPLTPFEDLLNSVVAALDGRVNSGRETGVVLTTGETSVEITITHGCTGTPEVVGTLYGAQTSLIYKVQTKSTDSTDAVLIVQRTDGSAMTGQTRDFSWVAVVPAP